MVLGESAAFRVPAINTGCVNMRKNALAPAGGADPAETGAEAGRDKSSRWDHVLTLLATTKRLSVAEVSRTLGVSESTVRRDFMEMERARSEEHTSELQSRGHLVCRLLLEKKKKTENIHHQE